MSSIELPADDTKPFWQDPSWLLAAVPTVLSVLVVFGYVPQEKVETLNGLISEGLRNAFLFIGSAAALWRYFKKDEEVTKVKLALKHEFVKEQFRVREELRQREYLSQKG